MDKEILELSKIKLVIWDLDDTFWEGTFSEGAVSVPDKALRLIRDLTDRGIINSICSKNELEPVKMKLEEYGIWDSFVFASINWDPKGPRIKKIIDDMALRPTNVLFLDDNVSNLQEAKFFLPDLQIAGPEVIDDLIAQAEALPIKDANHKRLAQYKVLEEKAEASKSYSSNEEFLFASNIRVEMFHNCMDVKERLHELIMRSNQLNFTKRRVSMEELTDLLSNPEYQCGYVRVTDNFGDYGIVGFYALADNRLEHFVFSCRTMGQMIEQWVYAQLGFPELEVVGEVRTVLNKQDCPAWINQKEPVSVSQVKQEVINCKVLVKGPCDLSHSISYIRTSNDIVTEFTYVQEDSGKIIDAYNHSAHIKGLYSYSEGQKKLLADECVFIDPPMLNGTFYSGDYDVIFLSSLIESIYGIYRRRGTDLKVVFGGYEHPLTDSKNWEGYISGEFFNGNNQFTSDYLQWFSDNYEYVGRTTPEEYVDFLKDCLNKLPKKTTLCIILGATYPLKGFEDEEKAHKELNDAVKTLALSNDRLKYIDLDTIVKSESDLAGHINHFQTNVYYGIASQMIDVVVNSTGKELEKYNKAFVYFDKAVYGLRKRIKAIVKEDSTIYRSMKKVFLAVSRKKNNKKN